MLSAATRWCHRHHLDLRRRHRGARSRPGLGFWDSTEFEFDTALV